MRVAIFDFDGTLYPHETYQVLMNHLKTHPVYHTRYSSFYRALLPSYLGHKMKIYLKHKMRERSMQVYLNALEDFTVNQLDTYFEEIAHTMRGDFNSKVLSRLEQHAADNIHVMLVSGAYTPLLHIVTKGLPFDTIIGTDIPLNKRILDIKTPIYHVQGKHKNKQIEASLAGKEIDWNNSSAYADSYSDLSVLELVGNPVAVQPERRLQVIAENRHWEIL